MKGWNEFFNEEKIEEQVEEQVEEQLEEVNEDHKETRGDKIDYVCKTVSSLPNNLVTKVYDFLEDLMNQEEEK